MDDNVGRVPAPIEAQVALEPTGGMFGIDVRQQDVVVRGDDITISTLEPTLPAAGVDVVEVFVQLQMLFHEKPIVGGERTGPGHTLIQTQQSVVLEHVAAVFSVFRRDHVGPRFQPYRVNMQIGHTGDR